MNLNFNIIIRFLQDVYQRYAITNLFQEREAGYILTQHELIAILVILIIGLLWCFAGHLMVRLWAAIMGLGLGFAFGAMIASLFTPDALTIVISGSVLGLIFGLSAGIILPLGVFLVTLLTVFGFMALLLSAQSVMLLIVALVIGLIFAIITFKFPIPIIIIITALCGAFVAAETLHILVDYNLIIYAVVVIALAVGGMCTQFLFENGKRKRQHLDKANEIKENKSRDNEIERARNLVDILEEEPDADVTEEEEEPRKEKAKKEKPEKKEKKEKKTKKDKKQPPVIVFSSDTEDDEEFQIDTAEKAKEPSVDIPAKVEKREEKVEDVSAQPVKEKPSEKVGETVKTRPKEKAGEAVKTRPKEKADEAVKTKPKERPDETVKAKPKERPGEAVKAKPKERPDEAVNAKPKERPDEAVRRESKEIAKEVVKKKPKEKTDDVVKRKPREMADDNVNGGIAKSNSGVTKEKSEVTSERRSEQRVLETPEEPGVKVEEKKEPPKRDFEEIVRIRNIQKEEESEREAARREKAKRDWINQLVSDKSRRD